MIPPPQTGSDVETIMTTHTSRGYEKVYYWYYEALWRQQDRYQSQVVCLDKGGLSGSGFYCG